MFRFVQKFIRPEDFEFPDEINQNALRAAQRDLARAELLRERHAYELQVSDAHIESLKARIRRLTPIVHGVEVSE